MEEQKPPTAEGPKPAAKGKGLWIGIAIIVVVLVILLAAVFGGLFGFLGGEKPQAVFFVGYPGQGDKLIPAWWSNRQAWPADWLYSEGLKVNDFFWRLDAKGVDVSAVEGTAPTAPIDTNFTSSSTRFNNAYLARFGTAPNLFDPHSYDALFTLALAFQKSQTTNTNASAFKAALREVSNPPGVAIRPGMWAEAKENITAGDDIDYQGASGAVNYDAFGEVGSDYEVWELDSTTNITQKRFIAEGSWDSSSGASPLLASSLPTIPEPAQTEIKVGTLFDRTGALKDFGWDMENATELAKDNITANGGITIGTTVMTLILVHEDDGTSPTIAAAAATKLVNADQVHAVIGATASSASAAAFAVIQPAGKIEISASSTSPVFTTTDTTDQFWRTAPSDALQGKAASWYAYTQRGWRTMSILFVDNAYGRGLSSVFKDGFQARGGAILRMVPFPEDPAQVNAQSVLQTLFTPGRQATPALAVPRRLE